MKKSRFLIQRVRCLGMLLVCTVVAFFFALTVNAAGKAYRIKDLGIQCTIPDTFTYIFSRDSIKSDADVAFLGMTKAEVLKLFSESNIYLEAGTEYFETDFRITMAPNALSDFSSFGDTLLQGLASEMVDGLKAYGYNNITWEIYHHTDTGFIMMQYSLPASSGYSYSIQYYTVMNSQAINFTCSFQSKPSSSDKAMVKGIVDSVIFENAPKKESEEAINYPYPAFNYSDEYATFHIPDGWYKEETDPSHTHLNAKFQRGNTDTIITYGCQDVWSQLSANEKQGSTRADLSFSAMTDNEIIDAISSEYELAGATVLNASTQIVNGQKCGQVTFTIRSDVYGISLDVTTTQISFLENGYMLCFSISQDTSGSYYMEFRDILESVRFHFLDNDSKTSTTSQAASTKPSASASSAPKAESNTIFYVVGGAALLAIVVIAIVLRKKKKSTKNQIIQKEYISDATETRYTATRATAGQILFCHKCGSRLEPGATACRNCGTVIPR